MPGDNEPTTERIVTANSERVLASEPFYPILKIDELGDIKNLPDQRDQLPFEVVRFLTDDEKVVHIHIPEVVWPERSFDALEIMMRATRARRADEIGKHGPSVASVSLADKYTKPSRYEVQHGRDDMQAALDLYPMNPDLLGATNVSLAESQGVMDEVYQDGQPFGHEKIGSIILLNRRTDDEIGRKFMRRAGWRSPFYASVDAPESFLNCLYAKHKADPSYLLRTMYRPRDGGGEYFALTLAFERSCHWLSANLEDSHGLVAHKDHREFGGMRNQGWRDSAGAMVHKNGEWANAKDGIAPIEVQGLAFDALISSSKIYRDLYRNREKAEELNERAWALRKKVIDNGFVETTAGHMFASGFDWTPSGNLRPLKVATSAAGRLLGSELLKSDNKDTQEMVRLTIAALMSPSMLTRWGERTLGADEKAYVPFNYHVGPIWIYDTNEVGKGFSNHGYFGLDRIIGATTTNLHAATGVFYEHVSGYDSEDPIVPRRDTYVYNQKYGELYLVEQVPPRGQTWSASTELAKQHRYSKLPLHATDPQKLAFEKKIWRSLPDHIQAVACYYEPKLALIYS